MLLFAAMAAFAVGASGRARAEVEVEARVSRNTVPVGETASLFVTVRGASLGVSDPTFDAPQNLDVAPSGRSQNFSWVNGRGSSEITFRYEITPRAAGTYSIGPIRVQIGKQSYLSPAFTLTSVAGAVPDQAQAGRSHGPLPASLVVDVIPPEPFVGQPCVLRVRLVQRAPLASDPSYSPPPTPGFWSERPSEPESFYSGGGSTRVLVTETRTRLYPLAAGLQTIGAAAAVVELEGRGGAFDPFGWFGGGERRQFEIQSPPVAVRVRALPPGAPPGFDGAVGAFGVDWSIDQTRAPQDQPVTVRLDVRGVGNLPLLKTPEFHPPGFEVFASTIDDSLGAAGSITPGRRSFRWTVLPRALGAARLDPPEFAWFDVVAQGYRVSQLPPVTLDVAPATGASSASGGTTGVYPRSFGDHALDPFARPPEPWKLALAGALAGIAVAVMRERRSRTPRAGRDGGEVLAADLASARGDELWAVAGRACEWLAARGVDVASLDAEVARVRFGGERANQERVRSELLGRLRSASTTARPPVYLPVLAMLAVVGAVAMAAWGWPRAGDDRSIPRAQAAERAARSGDSATAERMWRALWNDGARAPGLAARLAWCRLERDAVAPAALWVLRGECEDARDPALSWVEQQVREAGGLIGASMGALRLRRVEWGVLAALFGLATGFAWPRRRLTGLAALGLVICGAAVPVRERIVAQRSEAVIMSDVRLGGSDIDLEPGRVVRIRGRAGDRLRVWVGRGVEGWVPLGAARPVDSLP